MSWNNGFSRNLVLKLQNKLVLLKIISQKKVPETFANNFLISKFNKIARLGYRIKISQFEWNLHDGRRKVFSSYRSDV